VGGGGTAGGGEGGSDLGLGIHLLGGQFPSSISALLQPDCIQLVTRGVHCGPEHELIGFIGTAGMANGLGGGWPSGIPKDAGGGGIGGNGGEGRFSVGAIGNSTFIMGPPLLQQPA